MKKGILLVFCLVCAAGLLSCSGKVNSEETKEITTIPTAEGDATDEPALTELISSDMLGQGVYDMLQRNWDAWNAKTEMERMISSSMPGFCGVYFDDWEKCEEFLGFSVFHPLENSTFEKGTYVGMPEGYNEAHRFYVSFYGTEEGRIEDIQVESGYRDGDIRITVSAQIMVDTPKENLDDREPLITEDSGEKYVAATALLARGPVTYSIRVIGEPNRQKEVQETLEKVLVYFEEYP